MEYLNKALDKAKKIKGLKSDSELSLFLGNSRGSVSSWRVGRSSPDDYACFVIAEILGTEEKILIAKVKSEYEKDEFRKEFWQSKVKEYGFADSGLLLAVIATGLIIQPVVLNSIASIIPTLSNIYYAHFT